MIIKLQIISLFCLISVIETKVSVNKTNTDTIRKSLEEHQDRLLVNKSKIKNAPLSIANVTKVKVKSTLLRKPPDKLKVITREQIRDWAKEIQDRLFEIEEKVVRRHVLSKSFSEFNVEIRNGSAILEKASKDLEDFLEKRGQAAEAIMRRAEELSSHILKNKIEAPTNYTFDYSVDLDVLKKAEPTESEWELPSTCKSVNKVKLHKSFHFNAEVSLEASSVHVVPEVFACSPGVLQHLYWSEGLLSTFRENYAHDSTLDFQYLCSAKGFLRHYPAALWQSLYNLNVEAEDVYDCRLRPWYVSAGGAPRDILILLDSSGSMHNSSNKVIARQLISTLLNALTDDDHVNVLRYNVEIESPISCFNEKLVPANYVNSAAIMAALMPKKMKNESLIGDVLAYSVNLLKKQRTLDRPPSCQQAIVMVTDSLCINYTTLMRQLDPDGKIRLFVMWLHDQFGLRDNTRLYGGELSCERDGYFAELISDYDVTEQVMRILRVLERPLVGQRKHRLRVYSDIYAHIEDPRRGEFHWQQKENTEQVYRYRELRKNKDKFLKNVYKDYQRMDTLERYGQYYEMEDMNYRLQISVSVPVFESTTVENITVTLDEEKQRNSTRTYPVNRLLGVAGVDIPLDHLKLVLPYYLTGASGSLFILDHRGNIVLHNNTKPVFDGDILRPGYRTVDFLDVEQPGVDHSPRDYPQDWLDFRKAIVNDEPSGFRTMYAKSIFEGGMRVLLEMRDYYWKRIHNHYTLVVSLPKYNLLHAVPDGEFTQQLGEEALKALSGTDFAIHPEWLYCRHVDPHFDSRELELLHFLRRRRDEPNFAMQKLKHLFSPITPTLLEKTYQCNDKLMTSLSKEAIATLKWALEHEDPDTERECSSCLLGSNTAFFASESGLTRWQLYHATSAHADPPEGYVWPLGPSEAWYRRASAQPDTLIVHAPIPPVRVLRNTEGILPPLGPRWQWLTAARTLGHPTKQGIIGVAGYHFYPKHLDDLLELVTNFPCALDDESKCEPRCDNKNWTCVIIDDAGWIIADQGEEDAMNKHLANEYPAAMQALLNASVFKVRWVHDYQGVCFPPKDEPLYAAAPRLPSIIMSVWNSLQLLMYSSRELFTLLTLSMTNSKVNCDTEVEKLKRRRRLRRDFEREKFERLHDDRVIINRTRFAACDRTRPLYELQRNKKAMEALNRPAKPCQWPLVATEVPRTNLILMAIYKHCPYNGKPLNNSLYNEPVQMPHDSKILGSASRLACWRNQVPLLGRAPHTICYEHNYSFEEGYRQCGPWLPDPEESNGSTIDPTKLILSFLLALHIIVNV
ncbi:voltage-dependent calcium channel subunit alpha-2/delta-3-like [Colias croceus]|uniref:voltage-dependent calcium channel subunit alpha-2/delta-3-like n=1 Tax=Colias crocea TaxID=72248 RepID=UPI001E27A6E0|nr:voltage-dependent calcium channel subunit alpha-2/delta-3-like [Colias croceus]